MSLLSLIEESKPAIKMALPKHISPERIVRIAATMVKQNSKLASCTPHSFLGSLMLASQLGLEPNTPLGQAYIIPYGNQATFQIGYKGLIDLCYRTGKYKTIYAMQVYPNDDFDYCYGLNPDLEHKPKPRSPGDKPTAYYAVYKLENGGQDFRVLHKEDAEAHGKKYSKTFNKGPWQTDFDGMAMKTAIKMVLKYAPTTVEIERATGSDEQPIVFDLKSGAIEPELIGSEEPKESSTNDLIEGLDDE